MRRFAAYFLASILVVAVWTVAALRSGVEAAIVDKVAYGSAWLATVDSDPSGVTAAPSGTIAVLDVGGSAWLNLDGGTTWSAFQLGTTGAVAGSTLPTPEWSASSTGYVEGKAAKLVYVLGRRSQGWDSNTLYGDVADVLDTTQRDVNLPTFGTTYYLYSSDAQDDSAGSGARTVRVVSLDSDGDEVVATYTMDGTTKVSIGATHSFFQWMEVATLGTAWGTAAGNISITSDGTVAAPTVANTFEFIRAGSNRSMSARYRVPKLCIYYLLSWHTAAIGASTTMDCRLRADVFADDRSMSSTVVHFQANRYLAPSASAHDPLDYLRFPAGTTIKISCVPSGTPSSNRVDVAFDGVKVAE